MTDDEFLAVARKATPGVWTAHREEYPGERGCMWLDTPNKRSDIFRDATGVLTKNTGTPEDQDWNDLQFIAAANPADSIARIERHRAEIERLTARNNKLVIETGAYDDLLAEMRQRAEAAEAQVERLTRERDEARHSEAAAKETLKEAMADCFAANTKLEAAESQVKGMMRERDNAKTELDMTRAAEFAERDRAEQAESALAAAQKRVGELQTALEEIASNTSSLGDALDTACNALQRKRVTIAGKEPGNG